MGRHAKTAKSALVQRIGFWGRLQARAPDGSPIAVWRIGSMDAAGYQRENLGEILRAAITAHLEDLLQCSRAESLRVGRTVSGRLVIDATGLSVFLLRYASVLKTIFEFAGNFPEIHGTVTAVNAPSIFSTVYQVVSGRLTERQRQKVCVLGTNFEEGLKTHAGLE